GDERLPSDMAVVAGRVAVAAAAASAVVAPAVVARAEQLDGGGDRRSRAGRARGEVSSPRRGPRGPRRGSDERLAVALARERAPWRWPERRDLRRRSGFGGWRDVRARAGGARERPGLSSPRSYADPAASPRGSSVR